VGGGLPTTLVGSPDMVVAQVERCRDEAGAGVVDLMLQNSGGDLGSVIRSLELFAEKMLPRIREV
jgi:alkanesulfonate monooxygenase SsuD/methylene tetrahydromethanopterin reductase-like flavin-dependent oxidoreductase (luciferase family)